MIELKSYHLLWIQIVWKMLAILREQNTLKSIILILARPLHGFVIMDKLLNFPCGSAGKESTCKAGDLGLIPVLGRSPGEGKGNPLQYSCLENSMDCIVHGVTKSRTLLSNSHFHFSLYSVTMRLSFIVYVSNNVYLARQLGEWKIYLVPGT